MKVLETLIPYLKILISCFILIDTKLKYAYFSLKKDFVGVDKI